MTENPRDGGSGDEGQDHTTVDRVFEVLSHPHRRRILLRLAETASRNEDGFEPDELHGGDQELARFKAELYHCHLPRLEGAGYIEWDRETNTIQRGPNDDEVAPLLEMLRNPPDEFPDDWP